MSWYQSRDGSIVVCKDCEHLVHEHIGFQMGTMLDCSGRLILMDTDLLSMCGKRVPRPNSRGKPVFKSAFRMVMDSLGPKLARQFHGPCPAKKSACMFYNDVFLTCSASEETAERLSCPCVATETEKEGGDG